MRTYQDLLKVGESENERGMFCRKAVDLFKSTPEYKEARAGAAYYNKHNLTIESFQKFLYTLSGKQVEDVFSANYKLKTLFFRRLVSQQVQYVLGNGLILAEPSNKDKLGKNFDFKLQDAAKIAMAQGKAFGFWNLDHIEIFGFADTESEPGFCPLYSEEDASLRAGIRYWFRKVGDDIMFRCTLYEEDGYTEFKQINQSNVEVMQPKRSYKTISKVTDIGIVERFEENYGALPIVPLYANDCHESELVGLRECIDCYDYVKSGLANDIDDTTGFYWVLKNSGGMDDVDLARFVQRMKLTKTAAVDGDDVSAEAHTLDVPTEARRTMLELLRSDIYEDFQALDVKSLSAAAKTTQEIQAAYQMQDNKCADFEYFVLEFVYGVLALAGIDDNPTFTWNRVVNQTEYTNMILSAANYLTDEMIIKKLPFLTPEEAQEVLEKKDKADYSRFAENEEEEEYGEGV